MKLQCTCTVQEILVVDCAKSSRRWATLATSTVGLPQCVFGDLLPRIKRPRIFQQKPEIE